LISGEEKMSKNRLPITRREMLKVMGVGAGGALLAGLNAGCGPQATSAPTNTPLPPVEAQATPTVGAMMATGSIAATYDVGQAAYGWYDEWHPASQVDLLLWGPPGPDTDPWIRAMQDGLARFQLKYPEIKVTYEPVPWEDLDTKVNAAIAANQGPDILFEADREAEFPRRGAVRSFDDILEPAYIKQHKFYEVRPLEDNRLYWVHNSIMGPILFTNKALLAEKGYKPADIPKTWVEFGTFCRN